ncbi:MAG: glycosyltransferase family 2 protein [Ferruginibacter sp.]
MHYPKISIVTPSYNQGHYIEQTIQSIIGQGYPNLEYIIIDGGSTDNTTEVIKKYEQYISLWVSEPDNGQSDAINKGLAKCTGDIFNWINSDDYLEPGALQKIGEAFLNADADIVCGFTRIFSESNQQDIMLHRTELFDTMEATLVQQRINQQGMFYRLSIIKELGGINNHLHFIMDLECWFRYLCYKGQKRIVLIDNLLAHFRLHKESKTEAQARQFREEEKAMWYYILQANRPGAAWSKFFATDKVYQPVAPWQFDAVRPKLLYEELSQKYLYPALSAGNKVLGRKAYKALLRSGRLSLNLHHIAIFVKLFIGNIPFRKFFKNHA